MTIKSPGLVTVGGLTFNDVDANGVEWVFSAIDGWHDGPSVRVDQTDRIVSHGQFAQPGHRGGRVITLTGTVYSDSRSLVSAAVDSLTALLADGSFGRFTFVDVDAGARWVDVQLFAAPNLAWDDNELLCSYQLQLFAPDSYRYGDTAERSTPFGSAPVGAGLVFPLFPSPSTLDFGPGGSTGSVTISNSGTAPAPVRFSVAGPTPPDGFVIIDTSTGQPITFLGEVPTGSVLVLNGADGSVVIDGTADRLGDTIVTAWPVIPAGESRDFLFLPIGDMSAAVLTASATATYW